MENWCPCCGGDLIVLGVLGKLLHLRCRNCGINTSCDVPEDFGNDEDDAEIAELISVAAVADETIDADELESFAWGRK